MPPVGYGDEELAGDVIYRNYIEQRLWVAERVSHDAQAHCKCHAAEEALSVGPAGHRLAVRGCKD